MPRPKKDPNKPKGKMTSYAFFVQSEREAMRIRSKENGKDEMPSLSELSKFCSEKWKCLDEAKKAPFVKLAEKDKARYDEEMASYVPSEDDQTPKKSRKRKRQVDENHPKRNK
ncbi:high mobility group DSP1-like [Paramuricea clavata]|uniref:High mobility group DSP1-like n=1 Tax=Paramuricea clavata TaxID=317549 RepID=A0A6S7K6P6_PARCT|nr:high mobility group DSP1-like [Paramuricea clavata]